MIPAEPARLVLEVDRTAAKTPQPSYKAGVEIDIERYADGGPLVIPDDAPTTLTEALSAPFVGQTVNFALNGVPVGSAVTDASGVALLQDVSVAGIPSGIYYLGVHASYDGDLSYAPSSLR